jgi:hypothetical protein
MPGETPQLHLTFFDFGDHLDDPLNVQKEVNRFMLLDTQMFAMASIFGDGVVNGWTVNDSGTGLSITIDAGIGLLNGISSETAFPTTLSNLPPNSTISIYAVNTTTTAADNSITFTASINTLDNALLLATVTTGGTAISNIDNTVKTQVGFKQVVQDTIATHRHGGTCPGSVAGSFVQAPKIDLTQEVQGQLPNSRMSDIDASKIVGGRISTSVIPTLDHSLLTNIGTLTHPQLDSTVQSIQNNNVQLFGEVTSINLLKMICRMKYTDMDFDQYFENELAIIPGISPHNYIDWDNSNAHIDTFYNCISGLPQLPFDVAGGHSNLTASGNFQILSASWTTDADFKQAVALTNLIISNGVKLAVDTINDLILETFDDGTVGGTVANYKPTLTETNTTQVIYDSNNPAQGPLAAKFESINNRSMSFVKSYPVAQDWSAFDTIDVFVKSSGSSHSSVTMAVFDINNNQLATFPLLSDNEDTTLNNAITNGYAKKEFTIAGFDRSKIGSISIFTDQINSVDEKFFIDTIYLKSTHFLLPQGSMRLRYSTSAAVVFSSIDYDTTVANGTSVSFRVRVGSSLNDLASATFSSILSAGQTFDLSGSYIEIDISFLADNTKTKTAILNSLTLTMLSPASDSGFAINSAAQWQLGTLKNVNISTAGVATMQNTNIGNIYFSNDSQISELNPSLIPVVGVAAQNMPITPAQAQTALTPGSVHTVVSVPATAVTTTSTATTTTIVRADTRGLYQPKSVYRLLTGNYLIADTGNDRILEMKEDGTFVRGYISHNVDYASSLYALTANYNPRLGVLFITFSKTTDIQNFTLSDITIHIGSNVSLTLDSSLDSVRTLKGEIVIPSTNSGLLDRTLSVLLSTAKQDLLNAATDIITVEIIADINNTAKSHSTGIECFVGDYTYFGTYGITRPIYANVSRDDGNDIRIIVANAAVQSGVITPPVTTSVIEFSENVGEILAGTSTPIGLTFAYSGIQFSDIMLGAVYVYERINNTGQTVRQMLVAGVQAIASASTLTSSSSSTLTSTVTSSASPAPDDMTIMEGYQGIVQLVDMSSKLVSFQYISPDGMFPSDVYIDENDNVVVAESTFTAQSGRIITLDPSGLGDGQVPPIIRLIEGGLFTKIWDIRELNGGHIYAST